jgi:hypothetical protein
LIPDVLERYSVIVPAGFRARALCLIVVLICVPALTRAHQPLDPSKASASFSFRKSVDHPPEKMVAPALAISASTPLVVDDVPSGRVAPVIVAPHHSRVDDSPDSPRGPPQI